MREAIHIPEDDLIQYALGTLPEIQLGTLTAHISLCTTCRVELALIQADLASFAAVQPMETVPVGARERFLSQLKNDAVTESKFTQMRNRSPFFNVMRSIKEWLETPMPLKILTGAMAAALLFTVYDDLGHIHQVRRLLPEMKRFEIATAELDEIRDFLRGGNTQQVSMHPKPAINKEPEGHTIYASRSGKLIFTASNMPAPPVGKIYELWIIPVGGAAPVPAGLFTPDALGNAAVIFPKLPINVQAGAFGVTVENAAGAEKPTMPIVLSGQ